MIDIRQSKNYATFLRSRGWTVERIKKVNYFLKRLAFVGSILKIQRPKKIDFRTINKLCRKYGVFQVIIEPDLDARIGSFKDSHYLLLHNGFKLSNNTYLPSKTLHLDLSVSINRLIDNMKKDARSAIKQGSGLKIKSYLSPNQIKIWRKAWKNSVSFKKYVPGEEQLINWRKSFPHNNSIFLASHNIEGKIIGGALFTISRERDDVVCYYWHGFTNKEGRSTLSQYSLLYFGILWAKRQGCKIFDFEGIYDERFPNKSWLGFTHFKKSFGGYEVCYPGCYTKWVLPWQKLD